MVELLRFHEFTKTYNFVVSMKYISIFALIFCGLFNQVHAQEADFSKNEISLGGYALARYDSAMSLTDPDLGVGGSISPEDTLGLKTEQTVVRLDGIHRFNKRHAMTYSWYSISSDGNKILDEDIDWQDENGDMITLPVGAQVATAIDYDIFKLGYLWSFYHSDKVELAVGAGLHITKLAINIDADTTSSGVSASDTDVTLPLPVLSFALQYHVTPKFYWYIKSESFAIKLNNLEGTYTDNTFGLEYRAFKHFGFGAGLGSNSLKLIDEDSAYKLSFDNRISGVLFYVSTYF